jgi:hypothetical protein
VNILTEKERSGLDEVFMSISSHSKENFLYKMRYNFFSTLSKIRVKSLFSLKRRVKSPNTGDFTDKNYKKKKFLS